ncbi:MAG: hypothetical protein JF614_05635 [Acidobacteria bacterium]|nr:hypothetical protein [Acidobacteriota bacterium]
MRRFGIAAALGLLLLTGGAWSLAASDTPKTPQSAHRRKAIPKHQGKADVTLEDLYVDSEIGQVFSVNLGRADQSQPEGHAAGSEVIHIYQLSGSEEEPAARVEVAGLANPAAGGDDEEGAVAESETAPADDTEAIETEEEDPAVAPAEEPVAAPEAAPQNNAPPSDPSAAKPPVVKTPASSKDNPKTSPSAPPPPPIR